MKTLLALFLGVIFSSNAYELTLPTNSKDLHVSVASVAAVPAEQAAMCTLSITGYGNFGELGRIKVTMTAKGATCNEAAEELRAEIIKREVRLRK